MRLASALSSRRRFVQIVGLGLIPGACKKQSELPVLGRVGGFSLTDQAGRAVTAEKLRGKVWAAAFMFTRCPTVCPRITRRMRELQQASAKQQIKLQLISFSVDPDHDTPEVLTDYAKKYEVDLASWSFLTGDIEVVRKTAVDGFKLAFDGKAQPGAEHFGIVHGSHLVLVDAELQIRGYYRTSDDDEMRKLVVDAPLLA